MSSNVAACETTTTHNIFADKLNAFALQVVSLKKLYGEFVYSFLYVVNSLSCFLDISMLVYVYVVLVTSTRCPFIR